MIPYNEYAIQRLQDAFDEGLDIAGGDASFYTHELFESNIMQDLEYNEENYDLAHNAALNEYGVSRFSVYGPEVIQAFPGWFNKLWFEFWGI